MNMKMLTQKTEQQTNGTMTNLPKYYAFATLLLLCAIAPAYAGRPMIVDDAGIVDKNNCQLESWIYNSSSGTEYWAVPACNFTGNLEVALGGARIVGNHQTSTVAVLQGKTLFKSLESNGWGAGLVFGAQTVSGSSGIGDVYATVPVSLSFQNDRFITHANVGAIHLKSSGHTHVTWGMGVEAAINERASLTAETFGQQGGGKPLTQLGMKYWLLTDRVQLDATYGNSIGKGNNRFVTVGLVLFTSYIP